MVKLRKYGHWYFLAALALAAAMIWQALFRIEAHRGRAFIHVFDVGQGDAILVEAPNGNQVLIDGGPDDTIVAKLGAVMPFWDRSIDLIILTHPHADHLDGLLEVVERYRVGMVLESGVEHSIPEYGQWRALIREQGISRVVALRGQAVRLGEGAGLSLLAPFQSFDGLTIKDIHDAALVLRLRHASSTALFMSDAELPLERQLLAAGDELRSDALKVGHHGSKTSTGEAFLAVVRPAFAVISVGRRNRYNHPTQEVLDRLRSFGISVHRTDQVGSITLVSEGSVFRRKEGR